MKSAHWTNLIVSTTFVIFYFTQLPLLAAPPAISDARLFGPIAPENYVIGDFDPLKHPDFINVKTLGIPVNRDQYLRKEAAISLQRMYNDFHKEHPNVEFRIISSTRNWHNQKTIWEGKWTGATPVEGRKLNQTIPDPLQRARKILEFSSMPGTSRHHWGTDFDLNNLNNQYFTKGDGKIVMAWLEGHAAEYGFCRPYNEGRVDGYHPERWHWSYRPLAVPLLKKWNELIGKNREKIAIPGEFAGYSVGRTIASIYVNDISQKCKMLDE